MTNTMSMVGSKKFADLQAFPLDPKDYAMLVQGVRADGINIYLRLFFDGQFRTVILIDNISNLTSLWRVFHKEFKTLSAAHEEDFISSIFRGFVDDPTNRNIAVATTTIKTLCLHYLPALRSLKTAPRENVVGVILEIREGKQCESCYCRFCLDDVPEMTASYH